MTIGTNYSSVGMPAYDTVAQLKTINAQSGEVISTKGYISSTDKGGCTYLIKTAAQATSDGDTVDGFVNFSLNNTNVAVQQRQSGVTVKSLSDMLALNPNAYPLGTMITVTNQGVCGLFCVTTGTVATSTNFQQSNASWLAASKHLRRVFNITDVISVDSVMELQTIPQASLNDGQKVHLNAYHTGWRSLTRKPVGGGVFVYNSSKAKTSHDGGIVISPTVPYDGTMANRANFRNKVGETDAAGVGCWIRVSAESSIEISCFQFGAIGNNTDDDTTAIQAALNYASSNGRLTVRCPSSTGYVISAKLETRDTTTTAGTNACQLVGDGPASTIFYPNGNFTAINICSGYGDHGNFGVYWPLTAIGSISSSRIAVEFGSSYYQVTQTEIKNILTQYAYDGFKQTDWIAGPGSLGNMYVLKFTNLISFRSANYGFNINGKNAGSTTHQFDTCWANCSDSTGVAGGKGWNLYGINDVLLNNCAADFALDRALYVTNGVQCTMNNFAMESCKSVTNGTSLITCNVGITNINGIKHIAGEVAVGVGNKGYIIFPSTSQVINVQGVVVTSLTVTSGTLYKAGVNSVDSKINVLDRSINQGETANNGWFANVSYNGTILSTTGGIPTQGSWERGQRVGNGASAVGQPKGWECTVTGTFGTLNGGATTADTTAGSNTIVVSSATGCLVGYYITVAGIGAVTTKRIIKVSGLNVTVDSPALNTVVGGAASYVTPTFVSEGIL
jgi:hypothetical protein